MGSITGESSNAAGVNPGGIVKKVSLSGGGNVAGVLMLEALKPQRWAMLRLLLLEKFSPN